MEHYIIRSTQLVEDLREVGISCIPTGSDWYDVDKEWARREQQKLPGGRVAVNCGTALFYDWEAREEKEAHEQGRWQDWWEHGNRLSARDDRVPTALYPEWSPL